MAEEVAAGFGVWVDPVEAAVSGPEEGVDRTELVTPPIAPEWAAFAGGGVAAVADAAAGATVTLAAEAAGGPHEPTSTAGAAAGELTPDELVRVPALLPGVEQAPGGVELARLLASVEAGEVGAYELVEMVAAWQRVASWAEACQAEAIAELVRRFERAPEVTGQPGQVSAQRMAGLEVAARLRMDAAEGDAVVARADYLTSTLPDTLAAWRAGRIDTARAELIARKLCSHDPDLARKVEAAVLPTAGDKTVPALRRALTKALHKLAPETMTKRRRRAHTGRFVRITPCGNGMSWLEAYLADEDAAAIKAVLDAGAATLKHSGDGQAPNGTAGQTADGQPTAQPRDDRAARDDSEAEPPSVGNRRADVLAALAWAALSTGWIGGCSSCRDGLRLATAHGRPVTVNLTLAATTAAGLDNQPGWLDGHGPIPAADARRLAADGTWRRILTDPVTGAVLDVGRTRYAPPQHLVDHVTFRDRTCTWPGCDQPAVRCELDHRIPYPAGPTADHNLHPLCKQHHICKHHTPWRLRHTPTGTVYTSPTGHTYATGPEPPDDVDPPLDDADLPRGDPDPSGNTDPSPGDLDPPPF